MAPLNCHITTFNCGRAPVNVDYFASSLYTTFEHGQPPPDLLVLALQEIAPIGPSFLGGSFLAAYFSRLTEAVLRATKWKFGEDSANYESVIVRNVGMIGIMVFARREVVKSITWVEEAGVGTGLWEMGNKGAVGARIGLDQGVGEDVLTFVAAHLAPAEEKWKRRNEDWKSICERLVFEPVKVSEGKIKPSKHPFEEAEPLLDAGESDEASTVHRRFASKHPHTMFHPPSLLFLAGDLNYRTSDTAPISSDAYETWPQPSSSPAQLTDFISTDQLTRELHAHNTLHNLTEATITFPPTYKYSSSAQKIAAEVASKHDQQTAVGKPNDSFPGIALHDQAEKEWLWAKHRTPSWCDRILYLEASPPKVYTYMALPVQPTSDHRPVSLAFSLPGDRLKPSSSKTPFALSKDWRQRRAAARRLEIMVGLGAYLGLTSEGQMLIGGTAIGVVVGYLALRYLLAQ